MPTTDAAGQSEGEPGKFSITPPDTEERHRMIMENQGLVYHVALRLAPQRLEEAVSFGQEGLIEAVDRFDPARGTRFSSYAYRYIWGYIHSGLYLKPARWKPQIPVDFGGDRDEIGSAGEPPDHRTESAEIPVIREEVWERIRKYLDPRRYTAIFEYYAGGKDLNDVGKLLGISRERARQLIKTGLQHMLSRIPNLIDLLS